MGVKKDKMAQEETAVTVAEPVQEQPEIEEMAEVEVKPKQPKKKSVLGQINDVVDMAKGVKSSFDVIYSNWIKPLMDNRAQIKRRWNGFVTAISVVFFLMYVPILLFSKLTKGLSLGWDTALYACIGVYVAAVIVMVVITIVSGKTTNTQASKRWRKVSFIILFVVRLASMAISITAIIISGKGESQAIDIILLVLAITSIVFTTLSLIFGGLIGFFKWLISPAKIRRKFSFVALEWKQNIDDGKREQRRAVKKAYVKYHDKITLCLDNYILPQFGKAYIDTIDGNKLLNFIEKLPEEDKNLTGWMFKDMFDYALACGYIQQNPCEEIEIAGDVVQEKPPKAEGDGVISKVAALFKRKNDE